MIFSFIYYVALSKFVNSSFSQYNVHTGVQGGCLAFTNCENTVQMSPQVHVCISTLILQLQKTTKIRHEECKVICRYINDEQKYVCVLLQCLWKGTPCTVDNFTRINTDMGICFAFNPEIGNAILSTSYKIPTRGHSKQCSHVYFLLHVFWVILLFCQIVLFLI